MTPYTKARSLLDDIVEQADTSHVTLPETRYAQVGTPVVAAPEVTVACPSIDQATEASQTRCAVPQLGTFQLIIARGCPDIANNDGTNDPEAVAKASEMIGQDVDILWAVCNAYEAYVSKRWSASWQITGNLAITTVTLVTGID